jgi:hypothetical protein
MEQEAHVRRTITTQVIVEQVPKLQNLITSSTTPTVPQGLKLEEIMPTLQEGHATIVA